MIKTRSISMSVALACCLATLLAHAITLNLSADAWLATPLAGLSQGRWGGLQSLGLLFFAVAHLLLAIRFKKAGNGWQFQLASFTFLLLAIALVEANYAFRQYGASLSGVGANNWRLIFIACLVGLVMALVWFRLSDNNPKLWRFNLLCTVTWMVLAPVSAFVTESWVGGYERLAGAIYLIWITGLTLHDKTPRYPSGSSDRELLE